MKKIMVYIRSMNASGGIERVVSNLLFRLCDDYDIFLVTKDFGKSFYELPGNIKIVPLNKPFNLNLKNKAQRLLKTIKSFFVYKRIVKKVILEINPDYIYTTSPLEVIELYSLGEKTRKKIVASEHGSYYGYNKLYTLIKKYTYPKIYCVSVPNKMDTEIYKGWGASAIYIPHLISFLPESKNGLNTKVFLNVGRLTADKQQGRLLEIWASIQEKSGWNLWILGEGEEKEKLEKKVKDLNLSGSVKFIHATKNISEIYKQASCFLLTSRFEGFGMVLLEAMSFGIPCLSFDCPSGPRDIIKDKYNGCLIKNGDLDEYSDRVNQIIKMSKNNLEQLGNNAFRTVLNWNNDKIMCLWKEVLK